MSYISHILSSWQNTFCPSDWQGNSYKAISQASRASSFDEDHLSFVKSTRTLIHKVNLCSFLQDFLITCRFADEGHNTSCLFKSHNADFFSCWSAFCNLPVKWFLAFKKAGDFTTSFIGNLTKQEHSIYRGESL